MHAIPASARNLAAKNQPGTARFGAQYAQVQAHSLDKLSDSMLPTSLPRQLLVFSTSSPTAGDSWAITELVGATTPVHGVNNHDEMARLGRPVPDDLADEAARGTLPRARLDERSKLTEQQRNRQRAGALDEHNAHP
jgi:hypothetical protein